MRQKYLDIVELLESRLRVGDYALAELPSERKLAVELGVSHMTARRAVQHLLNTGKLSRPDGKMRPARPHGHHRKGLQLVFVLPAFDSPTHALILRKLHALVEARGGGVRPVTYVHEADPAILDALRGDFTGCIMLPPHHPSPLLLEHMAREKSRIVTLFHDFTAFGIPRVEVMGPSSVSKIVEHLDALGHKSIDCLNTEPSNTVTTARIDAWRSALHARGLTGELHDRPVEPFEHPGLAAYKYMHAQLGRGPMRSTAMFCVSTPAAVGVSRACHERGVRVGADLSLCGFGETHTAQLNTPSITVLTNEDFEPYLSEAIEWIVTGGRSPGARLRIEPDNAGKIWQGESSGPAPRTSG